MTKPTFCEFIAAKLGSRNWVVARKTARIVRKYGEDVVALSQKKYSVIATEYEAAYGARY